jgi:hypothetical protein
MEITTNINGLVKTGSSLAHFEIPAPFLDPSTGELMNDPVTAKNGHSYESSTCQFKDVVPNRTLKSLIDNWKKTHSHQNEQKDESSLPVAKAYQNTSVLQGSTIDIYKFNDTHMLVRTKTERPPLPKDSHWSMDASGSMGQSCQKKSNESSTNWTFHDLAAQLLITGINTQSVNDRSEVSKFATQYQLVKDKSTMTHINKKSACDAIRAARIGTGKNNNDRTTNLWAALQPSISSNNEPDRYDYSVVFCDGKPNEPDWIPKFICNEATYLKESASSKGNDIKPTHMFAIGSDANAALLSWTARELDGTFWYISDASMMGSVGCAAFAHLNTISMTGLRINGIPIGSICSGQSRCVLVPNADHVEFITDQIGSIMIDTRSKNQMDPVELSGQSLRFDVLELLRLLKFNASPNERKDQNSQFIWTSAFRDQLISIAEKYVSSVKENPFGKALLQDIMPNASLERHGIPRNDGHDAQLPMALESKENLEKWGTPYILQYIQCLEMEIPINDKDAVSTHYFQSNPVFASAYDTAFQIYAETPLDLHRHQAADQAKSRSRAESYRRSAPVVQNYQTAATSGYCSDDCFLTGTSIKMSNGTEKPVEQLSKGDKVVDRDGNEQIVLCLIERIGKKEYMIQIGDLYITDNHPVYVKGKWEWPKDIGTKIMATENLDFTTLYNVLLENGDSIVANGINVITLGHGITGDKVAEHDYYGNRKKVLNCLKLLDLIGFENGKVRSIGAIRDPETGWVIGHKTK